MISDKSHHLCPVRALFLNATLESIPGKLAACQGLFTIDCEKEYI
jgi:hypothetical protein